MQYNIKLYSMPASCSIFWVIYTEISVKKPAVF